MNNYYNALSEVSVILQYFEFEMLKKIPEEIIENIEKNKNEKYIYVFDKNKKLKEQELLPETHAILSYLYKKYVATEEKKQKIIYQEQKEIIKIEKEKKENFNNKPMFNAREKNTALQVVEEDVPIIQKIINKIISFFKR